MFGFLKKTKVAKELDRLIAEIDMNMQNNYKDAARATFREFEELYTALAESGELNENQKSMYSAKLSAYREKLKAYSHKDQKPYWTSK
ncbi:MAG: hypothetical protein E7260_03435 [Lachnospiraceae bacterium]|nr:hypothetical protein [Lachnospiraceae bacterium]